MREIMQKENHKHKSQRYHKLIKSPTVSSPGISLSLVIKGKRKQNLDSPLHSSCWWAGRWRFRAEPPVSDCSSGRPVSERTPPGLANRHHKHSAAVCPGRGRAATRPADPSHSLEGTRLSVVARTSGGCNLQFTRGTQSHTQIHRSTTQQVVDARCVVEFRI